MDFREYLDQALNTTITLDDGTRIKPIYIHWSSLSLSEQQVALQKIRQAAVEEIKQSEGTRRVRFEFNEIPNELHQMLLSLVESENGDLEWVEVNMD